MMEAELSFSRVRISATPSGCEKYGSPDARDCKPWAFMEKT